MLEADTVKTQEKNVRPKSEDVRERARRVVRRNECGRRPSYELSVGLFMEFGEWTIHNKEMFYVPQPP
jgi:hypothetical protein